MSNTDLSEFFSLVSKEKSANETRLKEQIENPDSDLANLFKELENAHRETTKVSEEVSEEKVLTKEDQNRLESFSNLITSFDSVKEIPQEVLIEVDSEPVVSDVEPESEDIPEAIVKTDSIIQNIVTTLDDMGGRTEVKEEIDQIASIRKEFEKFKIHIQQHIANQGMSGSGSGETRLEFLDDVQSSTAKVDGKFLKYSSSDSKWIGADASGSSAISDLDIDGGTDIGAALVDADLFIVDDGAGGTNRKTAASRIKTYVADVTLTTAAQGNITSLGTLTALTVDNVVINGATIGHGDDTDLMTVADGVLTVAGELDAATLDISGNADIDGTLEADAITVDGTTLAEFIADTAGAMVSSNTETGVTVTYQDADNTIDFAIDAAQTTITSIYATDLIMGEDSQTAIDFGTANEIDFKVDNAARLTLTSGALYPVTDNQIDLGTSSLEFKDAFFDGTVTSDAFAGPLTGDVTGNADTATALATARTIGGTSFDGTGNIAVALAATATTLANARTIGGVSFDGSANINLPGVNASGSQDTSGTAATVTVTDSTANTNFPVVFHDESNALLDDTGALRYNPSTGELLVPNLTVAGTTTQVDTVTMQAENAVIFEGATADAHETTLTIVDPTADRTINLPNQSGTVPVLAAASNTAVTSTPEELNILDGATVVVGEINALDLGSTAVGTAIASKAVILDSSKDYTGIRNFTITGEIDAATGDFSGDVDVDGTLEADAITVDGTTLAEFIADTAGGMVSSNTETGIAVTYQDADNTIDFVIDAAQTAITSIYNTSLAIGYGSSHANIDFGTDNRIVFDIDGTSQILLLDGVFRPTTDSDVDLGSSAKYWKDAYIDTVTTTGLVTAGGRLITDDATEATSTTDGALQTDGGLSVVKDAVMGDDLIMLSDASVIHFGANKEITLTHVHDSGLALKHTATADDKPITLVLQTGETDMAANDVIGAINFQAPDEGTGTDAILVAAGIEAIAEGNFSSSNNATKLSFKTGASEAATEKMSLSSAGILTIQGEGSNTTNATQGVSKAWGHVNGSGTPAFEDSLNLASLTDNATGDYTAVIANDMDNVNYVLAGSTSTGGFFTNALVNRAQAAGSIRFITSNGDSGFDTSNNSIDLHGDLS